MTVHPARQFADCVASIDARRLCALGLFGPLPALRIVHCPVNAPDTPELEVRVAWEPQARTVRLSLPGRARDQAVEVGRHEQPRGGGWYFRCPESGERCEKLYYVGGGWGGRRAKRLSYSSQSGSLADRYRHSVRRLTAILEGADGRTPPSGETRARLESRLADLEQRIAALPQRRTARPRADPRSYADLLPLAADRPAPPQASTASALGCEAALARGASVGDVEDAMGWLAHRATGLRSAIGRAPEGLAAAVRGLELGFCEDRPRISLRVLKAHGLLRPGWRRTAMLDWTGLGAGVDRCALVLDLRDDDLWFAVLETAHGRERVEQALRLVVSQPGEPRFLCPLSGAEVETIAHRAGAFAAPAALRLTRRPGRTVNSRT